MRNVFLSYSRSDLQVVQSLADDTQTLGCAVWRDQTLIGGEHWWDEILRQIRACDVFLFAVSNESLSSQACRLEYEYAVALRKYILPITVAPKVSKNLLPRDLATRQVLEFSVGSHEAVLALGRALVCAPEPLPLPSPLPSPPLVPVSYLSDLRSRLESSEELDFENQSALLIRIKTALRNAATAEDGRVLLDQLRRRHDLLAEISAELDSITVPPIEGPTSLSARRLEPTDENAVVDERSRWFKRWPVIASASLIAIAALAAAMARPSSNSRDSAAAADVQPEGPHKAVDDAVVPPTTVAATPPVAPTTAAPDTDKPVAVSASAEAQPVQKPSVEVPKPAESQPVAKPTRPRPPPPPPPPPSLSQQARELQGIWMVRWRDPYSSYEGMLTIDGLKGTLKVSYVDTATSSKRRITQTIRVEDRSSEIVLHGSKVKALGSSGPVTDYVPDHGHVQVAQGATQIAGSMCTPEPEHQCFDALFSRVRK